MATSEWYPGIKSPEDIVGCLVEVYWPAEKEFYGAVVQSWEDSVGKHKLVYEDGDEEEICMLRQFWKLKVKATDPLASSLGITSTETLYFKQVKPNHGRPAKPPATALLKGCRHMLQDAGTAPQPSPAPPPTLVAPVPATSAPRTVSHTQQTPPPQSAAIKLENIAAAVGTATKAAPAQIDKMVVDLSSPAKPTADGDTSKKLQADAAVIAEHKASAKRKRDQQASPGADDGTTAEAKRPKRAARQQKVKGTSAKGDDGADTSSSEFDAADALFKMANSNPSPSGKNKKRSSDKSGASSKPASDKVASASPAQVLAGDRAAAAAAGVMPGYITGSKHHQPEPTSPVAVQMVDSQRAGRKAGLTSPTVASPGAPATCANSWFMTCSDEEFRAHIAAEGWTIESNLRESASGRKLDTFYKPPEGLVIIGYSKKSFRSLKSVRVFLATQELQQKEAPAERNNTAPAGDDGAAATEQLPPTATSLQRSVQTAAAADAASPAVPAASKPSLAASAIGQAMGLAAGQLLAAGTDWQVHKLFAGSAMLPGSSQQTAQQGNSFMVLVRLPAGAISSSVDVKCGQRSIVVNYQKAVAPTASARQQVACNDNRYIVLPERISPEGVQASLCAATGSLVVRAAILGA